MNVRQLWPKAPWKRALVVLAGLVASSIAVGLLHDQALWRDNDSASEAWLECVVELGPELPSGTRLVQHPQHAQAVQRDGDRFVVPLLFETKGADDRWARRPGHATLIHNAYQDWTIRSYQIEGEAERAVDHRHVMNYGINDLWLGLYIQRLH